MTSSTRTRFSRVAVLATAGALAVTLVPAVQSAQAAAPATPKFAYRSVVSGSTVLSTASAAGAATQATPAGYQTYGYDAAADGKTWVACMSAGAATADAYDRTYALVLTHTDGADTTSRVLSTFCEANPVISADGGTVWWYADDTIYKYDATYGANASISGTPSAVSTGQFVKKTDSAGDPVEDALALAISPDGSNAALMLTTGSVARVRSAAMTPSGTKPGWFEKTYSSATPSGTMPKPYSFVFADNNTLVYDVVFTKTAPSGIVAIAATTPAAVSAPVVSTTAVLAPGLNDTYDLRRYAPAGFDPTFYVWRDVYSGSTYLRTEYAVATLSGAPGTWTVQAADESRARDNGATTFSYVPVAATLPDLQPASNKAVAHPTFALSASVALYRSKVAYQSYNLYLQDPLNGAFSAAGAAEVDKGTLEWSTNGGASWAALGTTSGKNVFAIGTKWFNGYSPVLARNTAFRWTFAGDYFTAASSQVVRTVKVVPIITIKKSVSGSYTTVYGYATRKLGTASLQRSTSVGWRSVASTTMSSTGVFTFGKRALPKGTYRIVTIADTSWAAGVKVFTV